MSGYTVLSVVGYAHTDLCFSLRWTRHSAHCSLSETENLEESSAETEISRSMKRCDPDLCHRRPLVAKCGVSVTLSRSVS